MQLLETIRLENGEYSNLDLHQERMSVALRQLFNCSNKISLLHYLDEIEIKNKVDLQKCRIVYDSEIRKVEFTLYEMPKIESLKLIVCDNIDYRYKYVDRSKINELYSQKESADDIIIINNGFVTDSSYANLLFYDGNNWLTPSKPLLKGTQLASLLRSKKIILADIVPSDLVNFEKIRLINAMLRFEDKVDINVSQAFR